MYQTVIAAVFTILSVSALAAPTIQQEIRRATSPASSLSDLALQKVLDQAAPVFGYYSNVNSNKSEWMKVVPDDTLLVHMNLPGAHDVQTWNYTQAVQDALLNITALGDEVPYPPEIYRCQESPIIDSTYFSIPIPYLRLATSE